MARKKKKQGIYPIPVTLTEYGYANKSKNFSYRIYIWLLYESKWNSMQKEYHRYKYDVVFNRIAIELGIGRKKVSDCLTWLEGEDYIKFVEPTVVQIFNPEKGKYLLVSQKELDILAEIEEEGAVRVYVVLALLKELNNKVYITQKGLCLYLSLSVNSSNNKARIKYYTDILQQLKLIKVDKLYKLDPQTKRPKQTFEYQLLLR